MQDDGSKAVAGSVASPNGDDSTEEADNLLQSSKKVKSSAECVPVLDRDDAEMEARDYMGRKCSYKDTLTGGLSTVHNHGSEPQELVFEDHSDSKEIDDPECPIIHLTTTDKQPNVWVRIPHLSVEYYDRLILTRIGNKLGKTMRVDESTEANTRAKYARISMEVDLSKPLIAKFRLRRRIWKVEYKGLHLVCFECGMYGHRHDNCPLAHPVEVALDNSDALPTEPVVTPFPEDPPPRLKIQESYGAWMLVQRVNRGRTYPLPPEAIPKLEVAQIMMGLRQWRLLHR
ncbi:hypothetical protein K2173_017113 [Erythroxylum novogranatense]|uniref:CCHC-type domain-containing protein n=1 Tax=Erythroxylum novogranatense TaxID=1862640 RepID=A0AAV8U5R0_9ROSI|nr:hypothetical protein K2173_017113 [Erythroxylum novogranatense]